MKYITNQIVQLVSSHEPLSGGETMIMVNGFEDLHIYNQAARMIAYNYKSRSLSVDIKLAGKKWSELKGESDTTTVLSMIQNGWVADRESMTYYRNLHQSDILVLMGTEDEEDTGGLKNCYTITPESMLQELSGDFCDILVGCFNFTLTEDDRNCVNKMYKCLFEFVAPDICKLSACADKWQSYFDSLEEFISEYFQSLKEWGLPCRTLNVPTRKDIDKKRNFLREEYQFISRKYFSKISKPLYKNLEKKLYEYDSENNTYSSAWTGWNMQGFDDYDDFCQTLLAFARGEDIQANKKRLLDLDYSIVDEILNIKLPKAQKTLVPSERALTGEPLWAFMEAFLDILKAGKERKVESVGRVEFEFVQAEIVTGFTDADDLEKQEQLRSVWENICVHTDGVLEFINQSDWRYNGDSVSINCFNEDFLNISKAAENINGIVKTASSTNTLSKIKFLVRGYDTDDNIVSYWDSSKEKEEDLELKFCWKFRNESGWLYDFRDIVQQDFLKCDGSKFIPIGVFKEIRSAMVLKGEEEFFDLYDEADIDFSFNLLEFVKDKTKNAQSGSLVLVYRILFEDVAEKFCQLIKKIAEDGFYRCIGSAAVNAFIGSYNELATQLLQNSHPENQLWLLDAFIHAFNLEENSTFLQEEEDTECSIVPPWHPAALQKLCDQKRFILDGIYGTWNLCDASSKKLNVEETLADLYRTAEIQAAVDLFPAASGEYLGRLGAYGAYSVYGNSNKTHEVKTRVKDLIKKEAIYDEEFNKNELTRMNDDAQMIYDVLKDYIKAVPSAKYSMSLVFINPAELQPIIAAIYHYTNELRKDNANQIINIKITILVKPENKGGRNYLAYWMDDYFSHEDNIYIRMYLNEWTSKSELDKLLNPNNDIVFNMDLLRVNTFSFTNNDEYTSLVSECRFPVIYKPSPLSKTSKKRKIELSQPQFSAAFNHTQVVRYRRNSETVPAAKYIAVQESTLEKETQNIINLLHQKSYWVVCVDRVMDGALLKGDPKKDYSIIGFSTGKGVYGQYNLTITANNSILDTVEERLKRRLYQLFHWKNTVIDTVVSRVIQEAGSLDGISLLSAINQKDSNINEFMAYVLTSMREKNKNSRSVLRILVHLDSYKHWFSNEEDSSSRPDFLMLSVVPSEDILKLEATVIECKISSFGNSSGHIDKARHQVSHGLEQLQSIFDPKSEALERRYWFSQLYRALVFAQVTFSDNTDEFVDLSSKLRAVLDGEFSIEWKGEVLGYWFDMPGDTEEIESSDDNITVYNIPQLKIQEILTGNQPEEFVAITENDIASNEEENSAEIDDLEVAAEKELEELNARNRNRRQIIKEGDETQDSSNLERLEESGIQTSSTAQEEWKVSSNKNPAIDKHVSPSDENDVGDIKLLEDGKSVKETLSSVRVKIGTDKTGVGVYWEFGNPQLANRHLLITGTSGQGKTYGIQTMLYEVSKSDISTVIFDYTEGFRTDQLEQKFLEKMDQRIDNRVVYFSGVPINPFKRNEIEVAGMKAPEKIADVAQRIANILTHVYNFGDQQFAAVFDACRVGLEKYGSAMNMQLFEKELNESSNKSAKSVTSKMAPFFHSVEFTGEDFDWKDVLYGTQGKVTIFQLTNFVREIQVIITEFLLWDMWHYTKKYGSKDKPFVVVLDEAQNLSHTLSSPSGMILTEGRKFGWSAWYATQSLKILSEDEVVRLMQAAFKLYFKPTDEEIVAMAKQLNPSNFNEWRAPLTNLKKGQCIAVGSRIQKDSKFGIGRPTITDVTPFEERD